MVLEVQDLTLASTNGAEDVIAGESMSEGFATHSVLLVSVGEGDVHPCLYIMRGTVCGTSTLDIETAEGDASQLEWCAPSSLGS